MHPGQGVRHTSPMSAEPPSRYPLRLLARGDGDDGPWAEIRMPLGPTVEPEAAALNLRWRRGPDGVSIRGPLTALGALGSRLSAETGGRELVAAAAALRRPPSPLHLGPTVWKFGATTRILGIVNTTPDSFSGDGVDGSAERAFERAAAMVEAGADAIDVGGESSRPGHTPVPADLEMARVVPAIERIARALPVPVFVDTWKASVAEAALRAGAAGVNDIWGLRRDPEMAGVVARHRAALILMHNRERPTYQDPVGEVLQELAQGVELARTAGIPHASLILDPGFGFGKTPSQSVLLLAELDQLTLLGQPVLIGTSRKSMVGYLLGNREVSGRLHGTTATLAWAAGHGAHLVRVHDVAEAHDTLAVVDRLRAKAAHRPHE